MIIYKAIQNWYKILIYISLFSVLIFIINSDFFFIPEVKSIKYLIISLFLLFGGFLLDGFNWGFILRNKKSKEIKYEDAIISHGLTIFGKYIPGKIWIIIGRAGYISSKYNLNIKYISLISFEAQLLSLWSGIIISSIMLLSITESDYFLLLTLLTILLFIALTIYIFTDFFHTIYTNIISKFFKLSNPFNKQSIKLNNLLGFFATWIMWSLSFFFLEKSLFDKEIQLLTGLGFVFAANIGLVSLIFPGGIGIREGILITILLSFKFSLAEATSISLVSRIWFLSGEIFIFLTSVILQKLKPSNYFLR
jgi:hypothetical protein